MTDHERSEQRQPPTALYSPTPNHAILLPPTTLWSPTPTTITVSCQRSTARNKKLKRSEIQQILFLGHRLNVRVTRLESNLKSRGNSSESSVTQRPKTTCPRDYTTPHHSIPSRKDLKNCFRDYYRRRMDARTSWRCLRTMRNFSLRSMERVSLGYR